MRRIHGFVAAALALAFLAATTTQAEDSKDDKAGTKLAGKWMVTSIHKDGKKVDEPEEKRLTITSDTIMCYDKDDKVLMACKYTIDTAARPNQIALNCTEGEHKGKKMVGIVEVDGDTAKVCFSKPDEKRPASFTKTSEGQCCVTLKRATR